MAQELKVIADFYDFMVWMIQRTEKFPRHHRYSVGIAVENRLQTVLSLLLEAKYTVDLAPIAREVEQSLIRIIDKTCQ